MDLNEINIFVKVLQVGSFNQAAKQLGMPNSTVSAKLSTLEKHLGVTLIQRTTRKLKATPEGQALFEKSLIALSQLEEAKNEVLETQGEAQGLLRVTAPVELGASLLPKVISALRPAISLKPMVMKRVYMIAT